MQHASLRHRHGRLTAIPALTVAVLAGSVLSAQEYSWQRPHARVLPTGDLEWAPEPFVFESGSSVRYIDFEGGRDSSDGQTKQTAWKHHPLDRRATGRVKAGGGAHTFVFKRGVVYRGALRGKLTGTPAAPVRLTSDPGWGQGEAVICGAERVTGWTRGAGRPDVPDAAKVWRAKLDFAPRCVWLVESGKVVRIPLARTPNWRVSDPDDVMSEWWQWEQPEWWKDKNKTKGKRGGMIHLGIDRKHLTGQASDYVGGIVWSEWGIVMGTPFPSQIESFDRAKRGVGFQGFWYRDSGKIITGNRYFLEDRPNFLDSPGEFWFDRRGRGGTLYLRLPDDGDPNSAQVEAARYTSLMDFDELRHVRISGLTFRFSNVYWNLTARQFVHKDVQPACVRLLGSGDDIRIDHCRFEHVNKAVRLKAVEDTDRLDRVVVADNDIRCTDHGAIEVEDSSRWAKEDPPFGELGDVQVMRNRLHTIGLRAIRSDSSHALLVNFAETLEVAGNMLDRCYGAGIFIFMGKGSIQKRDRPLSRGLIHHNKVTEALLAANDWGGIETWQGGPTYVFNNISGNPNGYWNWAYRPNKPASARLGFAYYLDGAFKNYHFNNIAWGVSNDLSSKRCNNTAFYHATPTILNTFFNNTAYNFAHGSCWSPVGGRQFFLGNLWLNISKHVFNHGKQKEDKDAVYEHYPLETLAYARNVFHGITGALGFLEGSGSGDADLPGFRTAAQGRKMLASDIGVTADESPVRDAEGHDFRPTPGGAAIDHGVRAFVPWGLTRMVGEWHFRRNNADPTALIDEHWYLSPQVVNRVTYRNLPRFDLQGVNVTADSFVDGPLEDWTAGAIRLNGRDQYLRLPAPKRAQGALPTESLTTQTVQAADWLEAVIPSTAIAGEEVRIQLRLKGVREGLKVGAHLHWLRKDAWGGFNTLGKPVSLPVDGEGPYTFTFKSQTKNGLAAFSALCFLSTSGEWKDKTRTASVRIPVGEAPPPAPKDLPNPHDIDGNFLVEVYFRTTGRGGALVSEMDRSAGFSLGIRPEGDLEMSFLAGGRKEQARCAARVNDGEWHHVVAEVDRTRGQVALYVDGEESRTTRLGLLAGDLRLSNTGDLLVGKGLAGEIEFLRIALGTLADAKTTIDELYAWQFDGPARRDFAGNTPVGKRDAGALEHNPE